MCIVAKADWHESGPIVGAALARRTWANSIFLDYLVTHPGVLAERAAVERGQGLSGIGAGLLWFLCQIGEQIGALRLWGEATKDSSTFYSNVLVLEKKGDLLLADREKMGDYLRGYGAKHGLAPLRIE
jgi:hypothetical protein